MPSAYPIHLLLDFDGTLTLASTLPLIYNIHQSVQSSSLPRPQTSNPSPNSSPPKPPPFYHLTSLYLSSLDHHTSTYHPPSQSRLALSQELTYLHSLRPLERASTLRLEASGAFRNVSVNDIRAAATSAVRSGSLTMRKGWFRILDRVMRDKNDGKVGVISVGWSGEFFRGCLRTGMEEEGHKGMDVDDIDIRANEIVGGESGKASRYFEEGGRGGEGGLWTSGDKKAVMSEIMEAGKKEGRVVVYVGDSVTDLECLVAAHVGICVRDFNEEEEGMSTEQRGLHATLERVGITCSWIRDMGADDVEEAVRERNVQLAGNIWWARDFDEICNGPLFNSAIESEINNAVEGKGNDTYSTADPSNTLSAFSL